MAGIDFSAMRRPSAATTATEPRRVFAALPAKHAKYGYARDVQSQVWERWHERRSERDLVVKMNTGGGKTVVGLLILRSCLNEKPDPVAYVTPDRYLAEQVIAEAAALGIETTDDPNSSRFRQGKAILVLNIYKMINGRSVFGVEGSGRPHIRLGTVLIDDAHACLATVQEQFTLRVPSGHSAFARLVELFEPDLKAQSAATALDLEEGVRSVAMRVPYWSWAAHQHEVMELLHQHRADQELMFTWPLVKEVLHICNACVTAAGVEVSPPCPPIGRVPSFGQADRRIYLTATLADDSVLVTHFNADPDSVRSAVTPKTADDLGDRLILTPLETHPNTSDADIAGYLKAKSTAVNVVVIVPSNRRADAWRDVADAVHDGSTIDAGVSALRSGHVGLVVLVNKYDGVDLPHDACRILVLDGLPEAYGALDLVEAAELSDSAAMLSRQVQRIEQGMGRGVRSNDDFCVVILLGSRLTERLHSQKGRDCLSPATRAQLELSNSVADVLHGKPFAEIDGVIEQCLGRDQGWVAASRDALDGVVYDELSVVSDDAVASRVAFDEASRGRFRQASDRLQTTANRCADDRQRGWLRQQAAGYLHQVDPVGAQHLQQAAQAGNRSLLKPIEGVDYVRLRTSATQAKACAAELSRRYSSGTELVLGVRALFEDLRLDPDPAAVRRFEAAFCDLGLHLGLASHRPELDTGNGPDVLWALGDQKYLVIECKSGATTDFISRHDAAQLSHSMDWFGERYDTTCTATPILVHPTSQLHRTTTARSGARIMTAAKLQSVAEAVTGLMTALAVGSGFEDSAVVAENLSARGLTAGDFSQRWAVTPRSAR